MKKNRLSSAVLFIIICMIICGCNMTKQQEIAIENKGINEKENNKSDIETSSESLCIGKRLCFDELEFRGVKPLMTEQEVIDLFGEPQEKDIYYEEALGYNRMICSYEDFKLLFDKDVEYSGIGKGSGDYMVSRIIISKPQIICIRDTKIGDAPEDIVEKFEGGLDIEAHENLIVLYGDDWIERGSVTLDDNMNVVDVLYGVQGPDERIYYLDYWFENGQVKSIIISVDIGLC